MKTRLIALGILLSLGATGALADGQHYATASTKKEAKRLATAEARATAQVSSSCYKPARQVHECQTIDGGFSCKAETSNDARTCKRAGWVDEHAQSRLAAQYDRPASSQLYISTSNWQAQSSTLYGAVSRSDPGPMAPTPFPQN